MLGNFFEVSLEVKFLRKALKSLEFRRNSFALLLHNTVTFMNFTNQVHVVHVLFIEVLCVAVRIGCESRRVRDVFVEEREMPSLTLQENSFQFNGKDYLQTHGTATGTKIAFAFAIAFANIFMTKIEKEILRQSDTKPIFWKRFIHDVISMWNTSRE